MSHTSRFFGKNLKLIPFSKYFHKTPISACTVGYIYLISVIFISFILDFRSLCILHTIFVLLQQKSTMLLSLLASVGAVRAISHIQLLDYAPVSSVEMSSLEDLWLSTGGESWSYYFAPSFATKWNFTGNHNPCAEQWFGIYYCTCGSDYCSISSITLSNANLIGSIPYSIGNLSNLQYLDLQGNQLKGDIPTSLGKLQLLKYLSLQGNKLNGNIPTSVGMLKRLEVFTLASNALIILFFHR